MEGDAISAKIEMLSTLSNFIRDETQGREPHHGMNESLGRRGTERTKLNTLNPRFFRSRCP